MAKLLLIEKDQISAALLEDRLRVAGHQVEMLFDATRAASRVDEHQIDLVVLDVPGESAAALALIAELRNRPGTRAVSIVALSDSPEPEHRMDVLRAGADDCLIRPFDPEELELRVKRLLGSRTAGLHLLQGDLVSHPLWAVLQYLQQVNKTGHLRVRGAAGSGTIDLSGGELVAARWQGLRGKEALLTLLSIEEGSFRVDPGEPVGEGVGHDALIDTILAAPTEGLVRAARCDVFWASLAMLPLGWRGDASATVRSQAAVSRSTIDVPGRK